MKRIQISKNLFLDEYIPKQLYEKYIGKEHLLINLLDSRLIKSDQMLRNHFGPVTINNWIDGGERNWSGFRTAECPHYSFSSQHSYGRASDKLFQNALSFEVQEFVRRNWKDLGITGLELNTSWVHTDVRLSINQDLIIFKP